MTPIRRAPPHIRHRRAVLLWRLRAVLRTIPRDAAPLQRAIWRVHAAHVVATSSRRSLERAVWPWQARPVAALRTPRGRPRNPTALP